MPGAMNPERLIFSSEVFGLSNILINPIIIENNIFKKQLKASKQNNKKLLFGKARIIQGV